MSTTKLPSDEDRPKRSRLEDEVLEILEKNDRPISFSDHVRRKAVRQHPVTRRPSGLQQSRFWPLAPFAGAFVIAFIGLSIREASPLLANILAWISIFLFFLPIVSRFRRPSSSQIKRWRGRDVDLSPPRRDWLGELRDRFSGRPRI